MTAGSPLTPEGRALLAFGAGARLPGGGFGWLDDTGRPTPGAPRPTWIAARMTYVFSLAANLGVPGAVDLATHGVRTLAADHRDPVHDGWYAELDADGRPSDTTKAAYPHAFVALATAAATAAEVPGAAELLDDAAALLDHRFLDAHGRVVESYDRTFARSEPYRGANASMHMVEALLVLGDVRREPRLHQVALGIAGHLVHEVASGHGWLMPEHFDTRWQPVLDYHADRPDDPFRPFGCTPGHLLEWSRLLLHLDATVSDAPTWLAADARQLFDTAVRVGWAADGRPGFVYTVDWEGRPVVTARMHWVVAEAIGAAAALGERGWYDVWWAYARDHLADPAGSWHHELDDHNRPAAGVWHGKPDVYHAFQATLLPHLPLAPSAPETTKARHPAG